jgi:hypothetical protein
MIIGFSIGSILVGVVAGIIIYSIVEGTYISIHKINIFLILLSSKDNNNNNNNNNNSNNNCQQWYVYCAKIGCRNMKERDHEAETNFMRISILKNTFYF